MMNLSIGYRRGVSSRVYNIVWACDDLLILLATGVHLHISHNENLHRSSRSAFLAGRARWQRLPWIRVRCYT